MSAADIRFEKIKTTYCGLRVCSDEILEAGDKDHNNLFFFTSKICRKSSNVLRFSVLLKLSFSFA